MKFSQRIGKTQVRTALQIESIDCILENRLWNVILNNFFEKIYNGHRPGVLNSPKAQVCMKIWGDFFANRMDEISIYSNGAIYIQDVIKYIKSWFLKSEWYEKYDFIEFVAPISEEIRTDFIVECNKILKKEGAGYRIIDQKVVQITSEEEIAEIENAMKNSYELSPVEIHLRTALDFLSNRESPDYRNSIKESISAVESLCASMTGDKQATLGKALLEIEKKFKLHGALKSAFSSLYGYTSDSGGIRHSLLEDDIVVTMEDAKFMLVSCSAFINYLKAKK